MSDPRAPYGGKAGFGLPSSSSQIYDDQDVLFNALYPFSQVRDEDGSERIQAWIPARLKRMILEALALRKLPITTEPDFVRAAVGYYMATILPRLDDPQIQMEWLAMEQASRAARYAKGAAEVERMVQDLADGLQASLLIEDSQGVQEMLERFVDPVLRLPDESRRRLVLRAMVENLIVKRAIQHVANRSISIRRVLELNARNTLEALEGRA